MTAGDGSAFSQANSACRIFSSGRVSYHIKCLCPLLVRYISISSFLNLLFRRSPVLGKKFHLPCTASSPSTRVNIRGKTIVFHHSRYTRESTMDILLAAGRPCRDNNQGRRVTSSHLLHSRIRTTSTRQLGSSSQRPDLR